MVQNEIKMRKPKSRELIHALVQDWRLYVLLLPVVFGLHCGRISQWAGF